MQKSSPLKNVLIVLLICAFALLCFCALTSDSKAAIRTFFGLGGNAVQTASPVLEEAAHMALPAPPSQAVFPTDTPVFRVYILDVGQGNSALLISPSGKSMLIDSGELEYAPAVRSFLSSKGVTKLDCALATHLHSDHIGAFPAIIPAFFPSLFFLPPCEMDESGAFAAALAEASVPTQTLSAGIHITWDTEVELQVLSPDPSLPYPDENEGSLMLRFVYRDTSILFCADTGSFAEGVVLDRFTAQELHSDVLIVGHHGSSRSTTPRFLHAVSPQYAAISCGYQNSYSHPHQSVLNLLAQRNVQICRTDQDGSCTFTLDGEKVQLEVTR